MNRLFFISIFMLVCCSASAQTQWEGKIMNTLRLVFHLEQDGKGKMDSPEQGAFGIPVNIVNKGDSIIIALKRPQASYKGKFTNDSTITGQWNQNGNQMPLTLLRKATPPPLVKPQTPKAPFPYQVEEVTYIDEKKSLRYGATLTLPDGKGPFTAVILITGSGQQDRDETIGAHKPFAVIADHLTRQGIAVLRVDDRGKGKSTGSFEVVSSFDFAYDVSQSFNYLKTRKEINPKKIGLIGHSEGGFIAPIVASQNKEVGFIVLLAGTGLRGRDVMTGQHFAMMRSMGIDSASAASYSGMVGKMMDALMAPKYTQETNEDALATFEAWRKNTSPFVVSATTGVSDSTSARQYVNEFVNASSAFWFKTFLSTDPADYLSKVKCPVLALNGAKDIQVLADDNLKGIEAALKKGKNKNYTIRKIDGLNHLFQQCKACTLAEYFTLEETFSPDVLGIMSDWIKKLK